MHRGAETQLAGAFVALIRPDSSTGMARTEVCAEGYCWPCKGSSPQVGEPGPAHVTYQDPGVVALRNLLRILWV